MSSCQRPFAAIVATVLLTPLMAQAATPDANLTIDVATHDMPGMPGGAVARGAMKLFGGGQQTQYGMAQHPALPGNYLDIALRTKVQPGGNAEQAVPDALKLGSMLPLRSAPTAARSHNEGSSHNDISGGAGDATTTRILLYWGCGSDVRPGQPREIRITTKDRTVKIDGTLEERYTAETGISATPSVATWPNKTHGKQVPDSASLVGSHRITGAGVPDSLAFTLQQSQDFMPRLQLAGVGSLADGMTWNWQPVARAKGYFLTAVGNREDAIVMWSSSEVPGAGMGTVGYVNDTTAARWLKEKVVLGPGVQSCKMPREAFAGGSGMLSMVAYGPDTLLTASPKDPEWIVRVRTKSTAMAVMGMDGMAGPSMSPQETGKEALKKSATGLLRGLIGR